MIIRFIDKVLESFNLSLEDVAYKFKYDGNRYKIPITHPLWWIVTFVLFVVVGLLILGSVITAFAFQSVFM